MLADAVPARSARLSKAHLKHPHTYTLLNNNYPAAWHRLPARPTLERLLISLRANGDLLNNFRLIWVIQPPAQKYSTFPHPQISGFFPRCPVSTRGADRASSRTRDGMRWTPGRRRGRWPQGELNLMSGAHRAERTALLRVRQNRVVPTPVAGAKLPVANSIQPDRLSHQAGSDGGKTNSSPGRARHKPSNHCAGNAGVFRLYLYARVRISLRTLHTRPRVQRAPGIPCSLSLREKVHANLGRIMPREREVISV